MGERINFGNLQERNVEKESFDFVLGLVNLALDEIESIFATSTLKVEEEMMISRIALDLLTEKLKFVRYKKFRALKIESFLKYNFLESKKFKDFHATLEKICKSVRDLNFNG